MKGILVIIVVGLAICNVQSQDTFECVANQFGFANQCLSQFDTDTNSPEDRATLCNGGCAQSVAEAFRDCQDNFTVEAIITMCTVDAQGRFCEDVLNNTETENNLFNTCSTDFDCAGGPEGPCSVAFQEIGCCASVRGYDELYTGCNVSVCDPPFILGTGTPPPPVTVTGPPATDTNPNFVLLFGCINSNIIQNQELQGQCSKFIPDFDFFSDATEPPTETSTFFFGDDPVEFCTSSCSERIAEALNKCESMFGSVSSVFTDVGIGNIMYAEYIQRGCATDNMSLNNRFCFDLSTDDSYGQEVEQITAANGPCQESLAKGECDATCKDAINSLSCCVSTFSLPRLGPEAQLSVSCDLRLCAVTFQLDGSTTTATTTVREKASTIHGAVAMVMLVSAIVSALMI